jgi:hypothetical protein
MTRAEYHIELPIASLFISLIHQSKMYDKLWLQKMPNAATRLAVHRRKNGLKRSVDY